MRITESSVDSVDHASPNKRFLTTDRSRSKDVNNIPIRKKKKKNPQAFYSAGYDQDDPKN
jgi:hypothetical protein